MDSDSDFRRAEELVAEGRRIRQRPFFVAGDRQDFPAPGPRFKNRRTKMPSHSSYLPKYAKSWGLVIGIDQYQHEGPLLHAGNDATAVAEVLVNRFGFHRENVTVLLNEDATQRQ
jgi:hypothetical protein